MFLDSYRFLNASLDILSTTLELFLSLDANSMEMIYSEGNLLIHMKKVTPLNHFTNHWI